MIEFERLPETSIWWPSANLAKGEKVDGILVLAFQAPLSFLNAHTFRRDFLEAIRNSRRPLKAIVLEASNIVQIDFTASQVLAQIIGHCREVGLSFYIARLESVRSQEALDQFGIIKLLGHDHVFRSVESAVEHVVLAGSHSISSS